MTGEYGAANLAIFQALEVTLRTTACSSRVVCPEVDRMRGVVYTCWPLLTLRCGLCALFKKVADFRRCVNQSIEVERSAG